MPLDARADAIADVVCPACDARVGRVTETEHGPLLWLWHNDREHFPRDPDFGRGPDLVHLCWRFVDGRTIGAIKPEEFFAQRCTDDGPLEVKGADVLAGIYDYRRSGKPKRVLVGRLLPSTLTVKLNPDALLRSTTKERYEAHEIALRAGFLTRGEIRELENLPPLPSSPASSATSGNGSGTPSAMEAV
jgi:hypothetical protein